MPARLTLASSSPRWRHCAISSHGGGFIRSVAPRALRVAGLVRKARRSRISTAPDFPLASLKLIAVNEWNLDVRPAARAGYQVRGQAVLGAMLCCYRGGLIYLPVKRWGEGGSARFPVSFHQGAVELLWGGVKVMGRGCEDADGSRVSRYAQRYHRA